MSTEIIFLYLIYKNIIYNKEKMTITILRTLFYQYFLLFIGLSIGFILNAEWIGVKSLILHRSMNNIFFPIKYDEHMERWVKGWGAYKVYSMNDCPNEFEIIDENVYANEEYYWCRFKYKGKDGKIKIDEGLARVRWKTWEYYYESDAILDTPERIKEQIEKDKQNIEKRKKEIEESKKKEADIIKKELLKSSDVS